MTDPPEVGQVDASTPTLVGLAHNHFQGDAYAQYLLSQRWQTFLNSLLGEVLCSTSKGCVEPNRRTITRLLDQIKPALSFCEKQLSSAASVNYMPCFLKPIRNVCLQLSHLLCLVRPPFDPDAAKRKVSAIQELVAALAAATKAFVSSGSSHGMSSVAGVTSTVVGNEDELRENWTKFVITRDITCDGMASVWKSYKSSFDPVVTIKLLTDATVMNSSKWRDFRSEVYSTHGLRQPRAYQMFIGPSPHDLRLRIMEELASAWNTKCTVHHDVRPDNVMIDADEVVKVSDLGVACTSTFMECGGATGEIDGVPGCMSRMSVSAALDLDSLTDIYSLGSLLYQIEAERNLLRESLDVVLRRAARPGVGVNILGHIGQGKTTLTDSILYPRGTGEHMLSLRASPKQDGDRIRYQPSLRDADPADLQTQDDEVPGNEDACTRQPRSHGLRHELFVFTDSGEEYKIPDSIRRHVKEEEMDESFGGAILPIEQISEIKKGVRSIRIRKFLPGYILVNMVPCEDHQRPQDDAGMLPANGKIASLCWRRFVHVSELRG